MIESEELQPLKKRLRNLDGKARPLVVEPNFAFRCKHEGCNFEVKEYNKKSLEIIQRELFEHEFNRKLHIGHIRKVSVCFFNQHSQRGSHYANYYEILMVLIVSICVICVSDSFSAANGPKNCR